MYGRIRCFRYPFRMDWKPLLAAHLASVARPLLAVLGPTASGKTAFSIDLCEEIARTSAAHGWLGAEVINSDSRQLYRGLDLGTAKATAQETRGIPHRMMDVLDVREEATVAWYKERAEAEIEDVLRARKVPVLVGGSMLYISALIDGLIPLPPADPEIRSRLSAEYDRDQGKALHARLAAADPASAKTFHRNNKPSIVRAAEILEITGKPPSAVKEKGEVPYDLLLFGLRRPRTQTVARIDARTPLLLAGGWVTEVRALLQAGVRLEDPGMKSHGYREVASVILEHPEWTDAQVAEDPALIARIAQVTRHYAKRQMTWWRGDERIRWIDLE